MIGIGAGIGISRMRDLSALIRSMLFGAGEVGVMYDPSDFSTMFQDSAGTIAAAIEQPVGLLLDKSKGLVLGPELVTNGGFDTDVSSWTAGAGISTSVSGGQVTVTRTADGTTGITQNLVTVIGKSYQGVVVCSSGTSVPRIQAGSFDSGAGFTNGTYTFLFTATATSTEIKLRPSTTTTGATVIFDNISVRELPGNHATQATSTARPVLRQDASGHYYLDFDGVDDHHEQPAGGGSTTAFFLCAGFTPDAVSAFSYVWTDIGTNTGYVVALAAAGELRLSAGNGTAFTTASTTEKVAVGVPCVLTVWDDGVKLNAQINNGTIASVARPIVVAGTTTATIGSTPAGVSPLNGKISQLIQVKNDAGTEAERAATKAYVASKAGVTL